MILYKYCDANGHKILEDCELKLPYVSDVNDPFDCLPFFYIENDRDRFEKRCIAAFKRQHIDIPDNFDDMFKNAFAADFLRKILASGKQSFQERNMKTVLLCFSADPLNYLMWAHYSQNHTGLVIGLDFNDILPSNPSGIKAIKMHPVSYSRKRPVIDVLLDPDDNKYAAQIGRVPEIKAVEWKYEKEYRTIIAPETLEEFRDMGLTAKKTMGNAQKWILKIDPTAVKSVSLGFKIDESLKNKILSLCKSSIYKRLILNQVVLSDSEFKLNLMPLK